MQSYKNMKGMIFFLIFLEFLELNDTRQGDKREVRCLYSKALSDLQPLILQPYPRLLLSTAPPLKSYPPLCTTFSEFILNNRPPHYWFIRVLWGKVASGESRKRSRACDAQQSLFTTLHGRNSLICNMNLGFWTRWHLFVLERNWIQYL